MRAYISISFSKRNQLSTELKAIADSLRKFDIEAFVFVDQYSFTSEQEKEMMERAFSSIELSDLFIAEVSDKAIGIGVEVGFAKAKGKQIIYLRKRNAEHSTTVSGSSDYRLIYDDTDSLSLGLNFILRKHYNFPG
ncbi:MAG TPA: nucleoside 2-deoxyribosyltransferase [Flavisolibacter sp.]|nr:nucleoside 2-deoxyribosyltransferase [Flavisolibacter sp.]